ncbi:PTS system, Fru family, IIC component [Fusobacterium animalis 7_1]|uniref:PTS system, Fru family, IIC component n=1 Tax=Fusobacterium animalis 7_1 TaxID=457405 RepID=A0A140PTH9_9FUSO|nr:MULTISPECIES: fructose-specific PTS transporter subunit EIIC [Fusobacterium]EEO42673.2 PTS system, Fru family, IIC component [Fusobacterium animalis 7_1]EHG17890.2 PTS system, Fru family, IIC component [Fusobacterium polymorphum F0401]
MEIKDLLKKELMIMDLKASTKMEAIDEMVAKLKEKNIISDEVVFKDLILKREEKSSTGLGEGIAMPHAKTSVVNTPAVLFARSNKGIDYDALDGEPVYIFFMIAASEGAHDLHIDTLAKLSKMLLNDDFTQGLKTCGTPDEVYALVDKYSEKPQETINKEVKETQSTNKKILAVTACPTGIAHTYMAEAALKEAGEKLGVDVKVETNGADGIKNNLTVNDINEAVGIIVAADKKVETARFNDRKVIVTSTADAIKNAETLIKRVLNNEAPIFKAETENNPEEDIQEETNSIGRIIYKSIMSGVSNMLPFVIGGGILLALSFVVERFMGENQLFKLLFNVGAGAFHFLIPILAGFIAMSIADKPGFMPGAVAGYMASQGAGFLGGLIGGFIAGYSIIFLKKMTKNMSKQFDGMKSMVIYPIFSLVITGVLMYFIIVPIFTKVNLIVANWLNNMGTVNAVVLGAILGGMMSVDMGGPINKAAYTFSIGVFTDTGNGAFMAAVMAGGMVPPLAIALAMTLFKNNFDEKEKQSTISNFILGLSFITEGAIPFAAKEPVKVISSCVIGAAIAGGLTQFWSVSAPAPHGGIFVIPAMPSVHSAIFFIVSIAIGAIISGVIFGILRRNRRN